MPTDFPHHQRRIALLVVLAVFTAFFLQELLTPQLWGVVDNVIGDDGGGGGGGSAQQLSHIEEMEMEIHSHRILMSTWDETLLKEDEEILAIPGEDSLSTGDNVKAAAEPTAANITTHAQLIDTNQPLPPYTIIDALNSSSMYDRAFALLVYDPDDDTFYGLYNPIRHSWSGGCHKMIISFKVFAYLLRKLFPERFQGKESEELIIPISSADYPGVTSTCIDHFRQVDQNPLIPAAAKGCHSHAPVLHFGSVFRQSYMFPNIIAMPMPDGFYRGHHLHSFEMWAEQNIISPMLREAGQTDFGLEWEDLIPQVVWRGTDFAFLPSVVPSLEKAQFTETLINWPWSQNQEDQMTKIIGGGLTAHQFDIETGRVEQVRKINPQGAEEIERLQTEFSKAAAVESMKGQFGRLIPRWKAVVLTAEAEVDASARPDALPWANMKFSTYSVAGQKTPTQGAKEYEDWENIDFPATGEYMESPTLAKYKYQIDLGGGGGTTWSGTVHKLAMPGLLFHHMTPTKDYIHDWMKPWVHYVPVSSDLHDLKQKFDWAESHPVQSKEIADEGTKLMRYLTSDEGFEEMFQQDMVEPLRRVIEAYQPISTIHAQVSWRTWREAIQEIEGDDVLVSLIKCNGSSWASCVQMLDNDHMKKISRGHHKSSLPVVRNYF